METSSKLGNGGSTPAYFLPYSQQSSGKKDVKDVWCYNLDNEMNEIMRAVTRYPYIGMVFFSYIVYSLGHRFSWNLLLYERPTIHVV